MPYKKYDFERAASRERHPVKMIEWMPEEPICRCNRQTTPTHCPLCGSAYIYGRKKFDKIEIIPPQKAGDLLVKVVIRSFRCRKCSKDFHEDQPCTAPELVHLPTREEQAAIRRSVRQLNGAKQAFSGVVGFDKTEFLKGLSKIRPELREAIDLSLERSAAKEDGTSKANEPLDNPEYQAWLASENPQAQQNLGKVSEPLEGEPRKYVDHIFGDGKK